MSGAAAEGLRLLELLARQKEAFEQIARGAPLGDVLDGIARTTESLVMLGARASVRLGDDAAADASPWAVPVIGADDRHHGTLVVEGLGPRTPSDDERTVLETFAQIAAVAVERDRAVATTVRQRRNAEALVAVGQAIGARLDLNDIVQTATDAATDLTGAAFGAFFYNVLRDDGEAYLLYTLSGVPREAFSRFPMPRNTAIFAPTFEGRGTVRMHDVTADERFARNEPYFGMPEGHLPVRSYLAVPVTLSDGEVAGGLFFGHPEPGVFGPDAERLAEGIASHSAIAIENARLYDAAQREIRARRAAFEERDRVARTLQQSLLPPELPRIPGIDVAARYDATTEDIGGDFYDVFPLPGGRWGVVVGDVCGKGVEAAKLTALARHTVHTAAMLDPRPAQVLEVLNAALLEQDRDQRFCTAAVGLLELDGGPRLTLALGGHPRGLLLREGTVRSVGEPGRLLGVYRDALVRETTVDLAAGDVVVLHTDGLTDVVRDGRPLGDGWVHDALRSAAGQGAEAVAERLASGAAEQQRGLKRRDDIALLALAV